MKQTTDANGKESCGPIELSGRRLHFVGIGGCGMSGLARVCMAAGAACGGTDRSDSPTVRSLRKDGVSVVLDQSGNAVPTDCHTLVISAAIKPDHPEVKVARERGIEVVKYAEMLGRLMIGRAGVAIAGTHGKSTTTSILGHTLIACGLDPTVIVGAQCPQIGGGYRVATRSNAELANDRAADFLLAEACEYDRSFHHLHPTCAAILNVEVDHLDLYSGIEEIVESFATFAHKLPAHGRLLIQHECPHRLDITSQIACPVETIGFTPQSDWRLSPHPDDPQLSVLESPDTNANAKPVMTFRPPLPGGHMAYNATVAAVMAHRLGGDSLAWDDIKNAIESFTGLDRRMQKLSPKDAPVTVVDDYGHHPTEIDATLRALRRHHAPRRLVCVFQPHQHSRTRFLLDQFAASFSAADAVILPDIYFVRDSEHERASVNSRDLVEKINTLGGDARHFGGTNFDDIVSHLRNTLEPGDLLVTMGAGDVWQVARDFIAR